ncbi:MAG: IPT/TIG domain-containing protein [Acidimicrobiales bacterium]
MTGRFRWRKRATFGAAVVLAAGLSAAFIGVGAASAQGTDLDTVTSAPSSSSVALGTGVTVTTTVAGDGVDGSPTGTVTFYTCGPQNPATGCDSQANQLGSAATVTPTGDGNTSTAISASFLPSSDGYWCVAAYYSGDPTYEANQDTSTDGCFEVTGVSSTTSAPGSSSIALSASQTDTTTVTGDSTFGSPTGTVTYYECGPTTTATPCAAQTNEVAGSPITLTAAGNNTSTATSPSFTPTSTGYWCFAAYYSGDSNYGASSDSTTTEGCFDVVGDSSTTASTPGTPSIVIGASQADATTVTGNATFGSPTGTVTYYECGPTATATPCTAQTNEVAGSPITLTAAGNDTSTATSPSFTPTAGGYWCFAAYYSGDTNYAGSSDSTTTEGCFDVTPTTDTTSGGPASVTIDNGSSDTDVITVTGNAAGGTPTGTVDFYYCYSDTSPASCTVKFNKVGTGAATLTAGANDTATATSAALKPAYGETGWFCFGAYYLGSSNYSASSDTATTQCFDVGNPPTITKFTPTSGKKGTVVTIKGTNLAGATSVTIDGITATIDTNTATKITVTVGKKTKTGPIVVTTAFGTATSSTNFAG